MRLTAEAFLSALCRSEGAALSPSAQGGSGAFPCCARPSAVPNLLVQMDDVWISRLDRIQNPHLYTYFDFHEKRIGNAVAAVCRSLPFTVLPTSFNAFHWFCCRCRRPAAATVAGLRSGGPPRTTTWPRLSGGTAPVRAQTTGETSCCERPAVDVQTRARRAGTFPADRIYDDKQDGSARFLPHD